jgi:protein-disulfide isomerase
MADHTGEETTRTHHCEASPPRKLEESTAAGAAPRTRLIKLAIVAAVVVAAIAIVAITTGAARNSPPKPGSAQATSIEQQISALLAGIPQHANVLGMSTAPVTLKWFGDLECPFCREFTLGALPSIMQRWVRAGALRIEYLSMETATREPRVFKVQQVAALAAGMQNKLWNFIETFYHEQGEEDSGYVTEKYLHGIASQVPGLDRELWAEDRYDPELLVEVAVDRQAVKHERFHGTPAFLIGRSEGAMHHFTPRSLTTATAFNGAIEDLLKD